jgi:acyl dehydratase
MRFFEDIVVGEAAAIGSHSFTAEEIEAFAAQYDPLPLHLDDTAVARSHPGDLCASGWHVACVWMRMMIDYRRREDAARRAQHEPIAALGVSPGFRDLQWPTPVYAGDIISYGQTATDKRTSLTRPKWGILTAHNTGVNQRGETVLSFDSSAFIERRAQPRQTT